MSGRDIVIVGTSAGGVEALRALVGGLPADFPGSVFIVMHTAADSPGVLAQILDRAGPLSASNASNRERIRPGRVYVAPPDTHMLLEPGVVRLTRGPKENRFRPAVDPLFRSAACEKKSLKARMPPADAPSATTMKPPPASAPGSAAPSPSEALLMNAFRLTKTGERRRPKRGRARRPRPHVCHPSY